MIPLRAATISYREKALASLGQLPPFSPILNRLMASLAQEDVSFTALAELIEKDTVLAGNVLRLVNSAIYGRSGTISSVRHAISIMGVCRLRNTVLSLSVSRMWNRVRTPAGWSTAQFDLHSVATALLSDLLAQRRPVPYAEGAFAGGLLHDIGKLLMAIALCDEYEQIEDLFQAGSRTMEECEIVVLGMTHGELSAAALTKWNLPAPIVTAVARHHFHRTQDNAPLSLAMVLRAADGIANQLGIKITPTTCQCEEDVPQILAGIGLGDQTDAILSEFQSEFEAIRQYF